MTNTQLENQEESVDLESHFTGTGQQLQRIIPGDSAPIFEGHHGQDSSNSRWDESNHMELGALILSKRV